jgi:hypothetical protein
MNSMLNIKNKNVMLMDVKSEIVPDGGGAPNPAPPVADPAAQPAPAPAAPPKEEPKVDEYGYEIVKKQEADPAKAGDPAKPGEPKKDEPLKGATGYKEEEPKVEDPTPPPAPAPPKEEEINLGYEVKTDAVLPKEDAKAVKTFIKNTLSKDSVEAFAKEHGLSEDQAKAMLVRDQKIAQSLVDETTKSFKDMLTEQEKLKSDWKRKEQEKNREWHRELKADPNFGGENFKQNVQLADRTLEDFMPELKKELTDQGVVLRPSVMRGLARIGERLFQDTPRFEQGTAPNPPPPKKEVSPLDFYNS